MNKLFWASLFFLISAGGCGNVKYTLNNANIPQDVETISIQFFPNYAPLAQPTLSQIFTEKLRDTFISQSGLTMTKDNGDLQLEGEIIGYNTSPQAVQGNEVSALNRLTIEVKVRFINVKDETANYESTFSQFSDFDGSQSLSDVEDQLIEEITTQLSQDIFNRSFSNW